MKVTTVNTFRFLQAFRKSIPMSNNVALVHDQRNIELVPPDGFTDGKLNPEGRAMAALNAVPVDIEGIDLLEAAYHSWRRGHPYRYRWAQPAFEDLRQQICLLARRLTEELTGAKAKTIQAEFYGEYVKLQKEMSAMRSFLLEHFAGEMKHAEATNRSILELVRELMLRGKG